MSTFASIIWLADDMVTALTGIRDIVSEVLVDMQTFGEPIPEPFSKRRYSGRFQVRIPPDSHRALAIQAAEAGISLNRLVSERLAG